MIDDPDLIQKVLKANPNYTTCICTNDEIYRIPKAMADKVHQEDIIVIYKDGGYELQFIVQIHDIPKYPDDANEPIPTVLAFLPLKLLDIKQEAISEEFSEQLNIAHKTQKAIALRQYEQYQYHLQTYYGLESLFKPTFNEYEKGNEKWF